MSLNNNNNDSNNNTNEIIPLIGFQICKLNPRKLPTNRQVLSLLFFKKSVMNTNIHDSAANVVDEVMEIWSDSGIRVIKTYNSIIKIKKLYDQWRNLQKNFSRKTSPAQQSREKIFTDSLDELFDISVKSEFNVLSSQQQQFLIDQRDKNRRGFIPNNLDQMQIISEEIFNQKRVKSNTTTENHEEFDDLTRNLSSCSISEELYSHPSLGSLRRELSYDDESDNSPCKRKKVDLITPELVAALDRTQTSSRNATHIIKAVVESLGLNPNDVNFSATTIQQKRKDLREVMVQKILENFDTTQTWTLHWDGKRLWDPQDLKTFEWLPIVISSAKIEQLLGVGKLDSATGYNQASEIIKYLNHWKITDHIEAVCFDTTHVNTGKNKGTCMYLERRLNKNLLYFACRHHVCELVLRSVAEVYWPVSSGPNVPIFKRLRDSWNSIDTSDFEVGIEDATVAKVLNNEKTEILNFVFHQLEMFQPRDDYRELLELAIIFLGESPPRGILFKTPGAMHHARWLSKAIYTLKIFMFKKQLKLPPNDVKSIREICIFIISLYLKMWFTAPNAITAPYQDLITMQNLVKYTRINKQISIAASNKFANHLWYLSEELSVLALFDSEVPMDLKLKMVETLNEKRKTNKCAKRYIMTKKDLNQISSKDINDFLSVKSFNIFKQFKLSTDFLKIHPGQWDSEESYMNCRNVFSNLKVVNDLAERAVALVQQYSNTLVKDDAQRQYLLQVVQQHRSMYPTCKK